MGGRSSTVKGFFCGGSNETDVSINLIGSEKVTFARADTDRLSGTCPILARNYETTDAQ
jgi:hypothetical protein